MNDRDQTRVRSMLQEGREAVIEGLGIVTIAKADEWLDRAMKWQDELVGLVCRIDAEFGAKLRPLNEAFKLMDSDGFALDDRGHRFNVSAINTQCDMLEEWLRSPYDGKEASDAKRE